VSKVRLGGAKQKVAFFLPVGNHKVTRLDLGFEFLKELWAVGKSAQEEMTLAMITDL
jgi:hypothetical protein